MKFLSILAAASLALAPAIASAGSDGDGSGDSGGTAKSTANKSPVAGPLAGRVLVDSPVPVGAFVGGLGGPWFDSGRALTAGGQSRFHPGRATRLPDIFSAPGAGARRAAGLCTAGFAAPLRRSETAG